MPGYKITPEDHAKLRDELDRLKTVERARVREEIAKTRAFGDLRENAEYAAAREAQAILEARIAELESKLSLAEVIAGEQFNSTEVAVGMTVVLRDLDIGKETAFTLVSLSDLATGESCVSLESPLGRALLGRRTGDIVEVEAPRGKLRYQIISLSVAGQGANNFPEVPD